MNGTVATHDAQKILADFRDHLARHDKPLAFLFGAGTSCAVRVASGDKTEPLVPAVVGLTALARADGSALGELYAKAWETVEQDCRDNNQDPNVENILSRLRTMISAAGKADTLAGLKRGEIQSLEVAVRKSIARAVTPDLGLVTDYPHRKFARWLARTSRKSPVEVFTVNYDVLIEHALEVERIPVFDGFVGSYKPFFHPDSLRRVEVGPRLKLDAPLEDAWLGHLATYRRGWSDACCPWGTRPYWRDDLSFLPEVRRVAPATLLCFHRPLEPIPRAGRRHARSCGVQLW